MQGYQRCRDGLRDRSRTFSKLDATQLVKHAFALRTAVHKVPAWAGKKPILFYVYSEPERWPGNKGPVSWEDRMRHRAEVAAFSDMVAGDEVSFRWCSYSELLATWAAQSDQLISAHAAAVVKRFLS